MFRNKTTKPQEGNTPLHYACLGNNPELILFLLRKAAATASNLADPNGCENPRQKLAKARMLEARNAASETPLLRAAVGGDVAVAQTLLVNFCKRGMRCWLSTASEWVCFSV